MNMVFSKADILKIVDCIDNSMEDYKQMRTNCNSNAMKIKISLEIVELAELKDDIERVMSAKGSFEF